MSIHTNLPFYLGNFQGFSTFQEFRIVGIGYPCNFLSVFFFCAGFYSLSYYGFLSKRHFRNNEQEWIACIPSNWKLIFPLIDQGCLGCNLALSSLLLRQLGCSMYKCVCVCVRDCVQQFVCGLCPYFRDCNYLTLPKFY